MDVVTQMFMAMMKRQERLELERCKVEAEREAIRQEESVRFHELIATLAVCPDPSPIKDFESLATTIVEATKASVGPSTPLLEKILFSKYDRKMEANVLYSWLHQFNAYFSITPKTDNNKVLLTSMHLSSDAILWYQEWMDQKRFEHAIEHAESSLFERPPPFSYSWDDFQKDLKTRFLPP